MAPREATSAATWRRRVRAARLDLGEQPGGERRDPEREHEEGHQELGEAHAQGAHRGELGVGRQASHRDQHAEQERHRHRVGREHRDQGAEDREHVPGLEAGGGEVGELAQRVLGEQDRAYAEEAERGVLQRPRGPRRRSGCGGTAWASILPAHPQRSTPWREVRDRPLPEPASQPSRRGSHPGGPPRRRGRRGADAARGLRAAGRVPGLAPGLARGARLREPAARPALARRGARVPARGAPRGAPARPAPRGPRAPRGASRASCGAGASSWWSTSTRS